MIFGKTFTRCPELERRREFTHSAQLFSAQIFLLSHAAVRDFLRATPYSDQSDFVENSVLEREHLK